MSGERNGTDSEEIFRTIGEVAESLDLPAHVLRFWETRFKEIAPIKRAGGRRFYRPQDVELVKAIRHLLYGEGYTIKGVQRILKEQGPRAVTEAALTRARRVEPQPPSPGPEDLADAAADLAPPQPEPEDARPRLDAEQERRLRLALADLGEARRLLAPIADDD